MAATISIEPKDSESQIKESIEQKKAALKMADSTLKDEQNIVDQSESTSSSPIEDPSNSTPSASLYVGELGMIIINFQS
jgi:hypothetical protein